MIEWNIFYKILGIPEDITEPTYYDLLGLHPKTCSIELVERMLRKRRNRLRQNITGPQFIPLVLKFEKEKLEHAAKVLRDPQIREKYNKYLRQKVYHRKHEKQKGIAKQRLLKKARDAVKSLLNSDGTLDDSKRSILTVKLKDLGIKENRINSLLERIPMPAVVVAKPSDEAMEYFIAAVDLAIGGNLLTPDAELKIMELAKKLSIDEAQAINKIDQTLKERNAQRGESDVSLLKSEFENRVLTMVPNGLATQEQHRLLLALARADNVPDTIAREVLDRCLKIVTNTELIHEEKYLDLTGYVSEDESIGILITEEEYGNESVGILVTEEESDKSEQIPTVTKKSLLRRNLLPIALITIAIGILGTVAYLFMPGLEKHSSQSKSQIPEKISSEAQTSTPTELPTPTQNAYMRSQESVPEESRPRSNLLARNRVPQNSDPPIEHDIPSRSEQNQQIPKLSKIPVADLRNIYSPSTRKDELLKDPAIIKELLADLALTMRLCYYCAKSFTSGYTTPSREFQRLMTLSRSERVGYLTGQIDYTPMPPVALLTDSHLSVSDGLKSVEELLSSIRNRNNRIMKTQSPNPHMKFIYRDLYLLSKMTDPSIPQRLREIMPKSIPLVAEAIKLRLDKLSSSISPPSPITRFGQSASPGSMRGISGRSTQPQANTSTIEERAWEPDPNIIKLLAVTAHYAELTASQLKNPQDITRISEISCSPSEVEKDMINELDTIVEQLILLTVSHPDKPYDDKVTIIAKNWVDHKLACKTMLQKAVVNFKAIGDILALFIEQSESINELKDELGKVSQDWQQTLSNTDNVIQEMRENCYYDLRLWDILIKHKINATIVSQGGSGQISNPIDSLTHQELAKRYKQEDHKQHEALNNLSKGLNAYINGQFTTAVEELKKAQQSQYVVVLAKSFLLSSLKKTISKCEQAIRAKSTCKKCDGTGFDACATCFYRGIEQCSQCKGIGGILIRGRSSPCLICQGKGYVGCTKCNGEGFIECQLCTGKVDIGTNEKQAIKELIAKAAYLYSGGFDYFTAEALEPSPKLQP